MSDLVKKTDTRALCEEPQKWLIFLEYINLAYVLMEALLRKILKMQKIGELRFILRRIFTKME